LFSVLLNPTTRTKTKKFGSRIVTPWVVVVGKGFIIGVVVVCSDEVAPVVVVVVVEVDGDGMGTGDDGCFTDNDDVDADGVVVDDGTSWIGCT